MLRIDKLQVDNLQEKIDNLQEKIVNFFYSCGWCLFIGCVVMPIAPLVSSIALPICIIVGFIYYIQHKILYNKTLTDGKREMFGRISDQDYTKWNGVKDKNKKELTPKERGYNSRGYYRYGFDDKTLETLVNESDKNGIFTFRTKDDLEWLKLESKRVKKQQSYERYFKISRAFGKALIPIIGVIWVSKTELDAGKAFDFINIFGIITPGSLYWKINQALDFHKIVSKNLSEKKFPLKETFNLAYNVSTE